MLLGMPGLVGDRRAPLDDEPCSTRSSAAGMSSRLFQEVREKRGLAYSVYSFAPSYSDAGLLRHVRGLRARRRPARSPSSCAPSSERLADDGVTAEETVAAPPGSSRRVRARPRRLRHPDVAARPLPRLTLGEFADLDEALRRDRAGHRRRRAGARRRSRRPPVLARRRRGDRRGGLHRRDRPHRAEHRRRLTATRHQVHGTTSGPPPLPRAPRRAAGRRTRHARRAALARGRRQAELLAERLGGVPFDRRMALAAAARAGDGADHRREDAGAEPRAVGAAVRLHPVGARARDAAGLRAVLRGGHRGGDRGRAAPRWPTPSPSSCARTREDRHDLLITHNFVIAWFVREVLGAPDWRWVGDQPGQLRPDRASRRGRGRPWTSSRTTTSRHLPPELRTGLPEPYSI